MMAVGAVAASSIPTPAESNGVGNESPPDGNAFGEVLADEGGRGTKFAGRSAGKAETAQGDDSARSDTPDQPHRKIHARRIVGEESESRPLSGEAEALPTAAPAAAPLVLVDNGLPNALADAPVAGGDNAVPDMDLKIAPKNLGTPPSETPEKSVAIALRVSGALPEGWRRASVENVDRAPPPAEKPAAAPVVVRAAIVATETHLAPSVPPTLAAGLIASSPPAHVDDAEEGGIAAVADEASAEAIADRKAMRGRDPLRVLPADRATQGNTEAIAAPSGGVPQPAGTGGLPAATLGSVVSEIVTTAKRNEGATPLAAPRSVDLPAGGAVRVMTLRLDLPDHGSVHVRMALRGDAMSLNLSADRAETAKRLDHDRDRIERALQAGGYDADIRAVDVRRAEPQAATTRDAATGRDGTTPDNNAPSGQAGEGGSSGRRAEGESSRQQTTDTRRDSVHEKNQAGDSRARGLYV